VPTRIFFVDNFAVPALSVPFPSDVLPLLNVTVPVGVLEPLDVTVAVSSTASPYAEGFGEEVSVVFVGERFPLRPNL
jgi:hypothetical protein